MPSILEFNAADYEEKPKSNGKLSAPQQGGGLDFLRSLLGTGLDVGSGALKELAQQGGTALDIGAAPAKFALGVPQAPPFGTAPGIIGGLEQLQGVQGSTEPINTAERVGGLIPKIGVPIAASIATGGAATPALAGMSAAPRMLAGGALEGLASGGTAALQGESPLGAAGYGALAGTAGVAAGTAKQGVKAFTEARAAKKAAAMPTDVEVINKAVGLKPNMLKSETQQPAVEMIKHGISVDQPLKDIQRQVRSAINGLMEKKAAAIQASGNQPLALAEDVQQILSDALDGPIAGAVRRGNDALAEKLAKLKGNLQATTYVDAKRLDRMLGDIWDSQSEVPKLVRPFLQKAFGDLNEFNLPDARAARDAVHNLLPVKGALKAKMKAEVASQGPKPPDETMGLVRKIIRGAPAPLSPTSPLRIAKLLERLIP